jgi:hypothetical protein
MVAMTFQPSIAKRRAVAWPMPVEEAVMRMVFGMRGF